MEHRSFTTAGTGTALSSTKALIAVATAGKLSGTGKMALTGRNYASSAVGIRYAINPRVTVLVTTDKNATFTDYSDNAQDGSAATDVTLSSLSTYPTGVVYLGTPKPVRGYTADMDATNSTASTTMTGDYWNGSAWVDVSLTDGTSGSTSLDQDGDITFTVPSAWARASLITALGLTARGPRGGTNTLLHERLFWVRLKFDKALDSSVTLNSIMPLNRSTAYTAIVSGQTVEEEYDTGTHGVSCIEALTDTGTANLIGLVSGNFTT